MIGKVLLACCAAMTATAGGLVQAEVVSAAWTSNGNATGVTFSDSAPPSLMTVATTGGAAQTLARISTFKRLRKLRQTVVGGAVTTIDQSWQLVADPILGASAAMRCDTISTEWTALLYTPATNITSGQTTGIQCFMTKGACGNSTTVTGGLTLTGSVNETYGNTSQLFTIASTGQNLTATWTHPSCVFGGSSPGTVTWTSSSGTPVPSSITSAFKPQITN